MPANQCFGLTITKADRQSQSFDQSTRLMRAACVSRGPNLMFLVEGQPLAQEEVFCNESRA
jgi:hypothetical protein